MMMQEAVHFMASLFVVVGLGTMTLLLLIPITSFTCTIINLVRDALR